MQMTETKVLSLNQQKALRKLHQKKQRYLQKKYICEGLRSLETALEHNRPVLEILMIQSIDQTSTGRRIFQLSKNRDIPLYKIDERQFRQLSDEKSPAGILFTVSLTKHNFNHLLTEDNAVIIYLDKIADPGNLGTLFRTASWFNIPTILLSPNCVDPYNPKTVRSSAGAIFSCNIYSEIPFDHLLKEFKKKAYQFIATTPSEGISLSQWQVPARSLLFFGQEAEGLSPEILHNADILLTIEGSANVESLNVAVSAAIIMHHLSSRRQD
jgi:TrmH family RNA methyltransferase